MKNDVIQPYESTIDKLKIFDWKSDFQVNGQICEKSDDQFFDKNISKQADDRVDTTQVSDDVCDNIFDGVCMPDFGIIPVFDVPRVIC